MKPASLLLALCLIATAIAQPKAPRIRIMPQSSDGVMQVIHESADGTRLVTHDRSFAPRLWDTKRQILLRILSGHKNPVVQVLFSKDGKLILTRSSDELKVWDSLRAKPIASHSAANGELFAAAAFDPSAKAVALGTDKGDVRLLSAGSLTETKKLSGLAKEIQYLEFSPDGTSLAAGAGDGARIWTVASGEGKPLGGHLGVVAFVHFSPTGSHVLTTGIEGSANLHESGGKFLAKYPHKIGSRGVQTEEMGAMFVGAKTDEFLVCDANGKMKIYRLADLAPVHEFTTHTDEIREIRLSKNRQYAATYSSDGTLRMWDIDGRKELPFKPEAGSPTAADFSHDSKSFWLGYEQGELYKYDVTAGTSTRSTLGEVISMKSGGFAGIAEPYLWMHSPEIYGGAKNRAGRYFFLDPEGAFQSRLYSFNFLDWNFSPDGRYVAVRRDDQEYGFQILDLRQNRYLWGLKDVEHFDWSPDSKRVLVVLKDATVAEYEVDSVQGLKQWNWSKGGGEVRDIEYHPNGKWVVGGGYMAEQLLVWDWETAKTIFGHPKIEGAFQKFAVSPDGKYVFETELNRYRLAEAETGKVIVDENESPEKKLTVHSFKFSATGNRVAVLLEQPPYYLKRTAIVLNTADGKEIFRTESDGAVSFDQAGNRVLVCNGNSATLYDLKTRGQVLTLRHTGTAKSASFVAGETRIFTVDDVDGGTVWDMSGKKLASVVVMDGDTQKSARWLVYDQEGRYDASDPSNVVGAYFILEWDGGLEPISMPQLKGQFYEPNLLAKALGMDKEAMRDVPALESLRLFPDLTVKPGSKEQVVDIQATERDSGGTGKVTAYLNGKQVYSKKSATYVQLDLKDYEQFMLPETRLPEGQKGNLLSVTVSNENGDLTSTPVTMDVGVPAGLKAPDVRLHALMVGVGDYVGTSSDLIAPPTDARELAKAVDQVSQKLLPNRTDITILATDEKDPTKRPTRANVLKWFADTKKTATSSDVVMVFFAGHGTSKIGEKSDYFFLTSDADPANLTATLANTAAISGEDLRAALGEVAASKQVVILDTCHSGAASASLLEADRSVSGEYQRAWEAIKDSTGTWLLAGSAADQKSYESTNVEHGMLTYSLLEAIDKASSEGLRQTPSGELFVDVERWLSYAANRVESLKAETGVKGLQRPEFKRSTKGNTFDIGVTSADKRGFLGLKAPKPIVIVGNFQMDEEDPLGLEPLIQKSMSEAKSIKPWYDIAKHPNVYRMAGSYSVDGEKVKVKLFVQKFDADQNRKTLQTIDLEGTRAGLETLAAKIRQEIDTRIKQIEADRAKPQGEAKGG